MKEGLTQYRIMAETKGYAGTVLVAAEDAIQAIQRVQRIVWGVVPNGRICIRKVEMVEG